MIMGHSCAESGIESLHALSSNDIHTAALFQYHHAGIPYQCSTSRGHSSGQHNTNTAGFWQDKTRKLINEQLPKRLTAGLTGRAYVSCCAIRPTDTCVYPNQKHDKQPKKL